MRGGGGARRPAGAVGPRTLRLAVVLLAVAAAFSGRGAPAANRTPAGGPTPADWRALARAAVPETAPTRDLDGEPRIGANDLARLLGATKFWRGDVRKLVLRVRGHRIQLTADNPFALVNDATVRLPAAVRSVDGELQIPVALVDSLPRDTTLARLLFDPGRAVVFQVPASGVVRAPRIAVGEDGTRLTFAVERPEEAVVASRSRAHFRVLFSGYFVGTLPDSLPAASLVRSIHPIPTASGSGFELRVAPRAEGFRMIAEPAAGRVSLVFAERPRDPFEAFAPEGPPGPRPLKVVVLDPGHGGSDAGVAADGAVEKNLTLALAQLIRGEIVRRLAATVVLTREDDRDLSVEQRAEIANRARADVVLSLHFDGFAGRQARGVTAYCPPATYGPGAGAAADRGPALLPWRDVAIRHAVQSRELADDILSALELGAHGPTRLREVLPYALLGVNAPGLMLEVATLTSEADRSRLAEPGRLAELAATVVDGLEAYRSGE